MMGSSDNSSLTISNSCNARKLRPLIPKPNIFSTTNPSSPSCVGFSNSQELFSLHSPSGGEQSRPELGAQVSSRWNPTPEQLRTLEDLYRRGMRTPSAEQIQYITSQLRRYGKVEGKNVFYWFQNHKARERQKRRRRTEAALELDCLLDRKDSASCWVGFEQSKDWVPRNCSISPEEPLLFSIPERGQTPPERLWKETLQLYGDNLTSHHQNANIEKTAVREEANKEDKDNGETCKIETLQLFPLHSDGINSSNPTTNNSFTIPTFNHSHHDLIQFFQFLPLKN